MTRQEIYDLLRVSKGDKVIPYYSFTGTRAELYRELDEPLPDDFAWYEVDGLKIFVIKDSDGTVLIPKKYAIFLILKPGTYGS